MSVTYFLYANNVSINSTVTIIPESMNYKHFESVLTSLKPLFFFIGEYKDGVMVI